jgi:hypothetical protein
MKRRNVRPTLKPNVQPWDRLAGRLTRPLSEDEKQAMSSVYVDNSMQKISKNWRRLKRDAWKALRKLRQKP